MKDGRAITYHREFYDWNDCSIGDKPVKEEWYDTSGITRTDFYKGGKIATRIHYCNGAVQNIVNF
ncbi:hypothetical protein FACS189465_0220 [Clostridia bacterium]|nr:hypothetical protein FACS189465_0220 [Clostridia bacterium]